MTMTLLLISCLAAALDWIAGHAGKDVVLVTPGQMARLFLEARDPGKEERGR
jgi:hypothetical protein